MWDMYPFPGNINPAAAQAAAAEAMAQWDVEGPKKSRSEYDLQSGHPTILI